MSSRGKREPHATTAAPLPSSPAYASSSSRAIGQGQRASARTSLGFQDIQPSQRTPSAHMALHQPLLPAIPASFTHHRGEISIDSTSSRTSYPSPRPTTANLEEPPSPEDLPGLQGRRSDAAQRRVFRQRRKDPSCDACRERKVKCDATTSGSCSECIARGIRCQFTRDSNRRMSSIKQVQELQKQIGQMRKENERLKLMVTPGDRMELDTPESSPITGYHTRRRSGRMYQTYAQAVRNLNRIARGIFKPPNTYRIYHPHANSPFDKSVLPNKARCLELVASCRNTFVQALPLIEWDLLLDQVGSLYETESALYVSRSWLAVLFSVLALGCLQMVNGPGDQSERNDLLDKAAQQIHLEDGEIGLDHCRAGLLISIYYLEANERPTAWLWLSRTVSMGFEMGLNEEPQSAVNDEDAEVRRRIWWSVYLWERLLSLELSRPLLIDDEDIRIGLPRNVSSATHQRQSLAVITATPLMRLYGMLRRMLRTSDTSWATLMTFESLLEPVAASYPGQPSQTTLTDNHTSFLYFTILLSNAKIFLHRQNLSPVKSKEERLAALESCVGAAQATSQCINDTLQQASQIAESSSAPAQGNRLDLIQWIRSIASSVMCTHLWRCILVLSCAQDFTSGLICARICRVIGTMRQINVMCGRQLIFFLERVMAIPGQGDVRRQNLIEDLEMLAYTTGDMQGDSQRAWVWTEPDLGGSTSQQTSHPSLESSETLGSAESTPPDEVWARVETLLEHLQGERNVQRPLPEFDVEPRSPSESQAGPRLRRRNSSSRKRMSIANII